MNIEQQLNHFAAEINHHGIRAGLIYLNQLTDFRYTALFQFVDDKLHNRHLIDRTQTVESSFPIIDICESYCVYVHQSQSPFLLSNASTDDRVASHNNRDTIRAYYGFPLFDPDGNLFGSLCHFDELPKQLDDAHLDLLLQIPQILQPYLLSK